MQMGLKYRKNLKYRKDLIILRRSKIQKEPKIQKRSNNTERSKILKNLKKDLIALEKGLNCCLPNYCLPEGKSDRQHFFKYLEQGRIISFFKCKLSDPADEHDLPEKRELFREQWRDFLWIFPRRLGLASTHGNTGS